MPGSIAESTEEGESGGTLSVEHQHVEPKMSQCDNPNVTPKCAPLT